MSQITIRSESLRYEIVGLISASFRFDLVQVCPNLSAPIETDTLASEEGNHYQVLVTNLKPEHTIIRVYRCPVLAAAEFERQYHEYLGWYRGLDAGFVAANDHQVNGQRDRIEHEEMFYRLNRDITF